MEIKGNILFSIKKEGDEFISSAELYVPLQGNAFSIRIFDLSTEHKPDAYVLARTAQETWNNKNARKLIVDGSYLEAGKIALQNLLIIDSKCKLDNSDTSHMLIDRFSLSIKLYRDFDISHFSFFDIRANNPNLKFEKMTDAATVEIPTGKALVQIEKFEKYININIYDSEHALIYSERVESNGEDFRDYTFNSILLGLSRVYSDKIKEKVARDMLFGIRFNMMKLSNNLVELIIERQFDYKAQRLVNLIGDTIEI